jgi:hypothetical protein
VADNDCERIFLFVAKDMHLDTLTSYQAVFKREIIVTRVTFSGCTAPTEKKFGLRAVANLTHAFRHIFRVRAHKSLKGMPLHVTESGH